MLSAYLSFLSVVEIDTIHCEENFIQRLPEWPHH